MILISHQTRSRDGRFKAVANKGRQEFVETHGGSRTKLYRTWQRMRARCYNPLHTGKQWDDYGGRGITVCDEWLNDFAAFRDWALANGYDPSLTIDRWPDKNGNYEPSNCRWATMSEQALNRRPKRWIKRP